MNMAQRGKEEEIGEGDKERKERERREGEKGRERREVYNIIGKYIIE